jgi:hypothetical protein
LIKWETLISTKVDPMWKSLMIQTEWQTIRYASIHLPPCHHEKKTHEFYFIF